MKCGKKTLKIKILLASLFLALLSNAGDMEDEYKKASELFQNGDYETAEIISERILRNYPYHDAAALLMYESLYKMKNDAYLKAYETLLKKSDYVKIELFKFLIANNESLKAEDVYTAIENKSEVEDIFLNYLLLNKKYSKVVYYSSDNKYIEKIDKLKTAADSEYYKAVKSLKNNKVNDAISFLNEAISIYPESYLFHLKLAEVYADNKRYFIAEKEFLKALEIFPDTSIYEKLFFLYNDMKEYGKLYAISQKIKDIPYVKETLKQISYRDKNMNSTKVLKREGDKIFVDGRAFDKINVGDTYVFGKGRETLKDNETGEEFALIKENYAKVRVYDVLDKTVVLVILEEYKTIEEQNEYVIY